MPSTDLPISGKHGFLALRSRQVGSTPVRLRVELDRGEFLARKNDVRGASKQRRMKRSNARKIALLEPLASKMKGRINIFLYPEMKCPSGD